MFPAWGCALGCCLLPVPWGGLGGFCSRRQPCGGTGVREGAGEHQELPVSSLLSCKLCCDKCFWGLSPLPGHVFLQVLGAACRAHPPARPKAAGTSRLGRELGAAGRCRRMGRRCRIRETSSSCCATSPRSISVANLSLLQAIIIIKKNNLQKILQRVSLCAVFELRLVNQGLFV